MKDFKGYIGYDGTVIQNPALVNGVHSVYLSKIDSQIKT